MNRTEPTDYIVPSGPERHRKDTFRDYFWLTVLWTLVAIVIGPLLIVCFVVGAMQRIMEQDVKRQREKDNFNT